MARSKFSLLFVPFQRRGAMKNITCSEFIKNLPKAELHVHIEGTMEPEQLFLFADRNKIKVPSNLITQENQYAFYDYNSFIDTYILATNVLQQEQDFYDLTMAYLKKAADQGVLHTEIFFDLQTYMPRNMAPEIIIDGIEQAIIDGQKQLGISAFLIMCFIRHLSENDAFKALELAHSKHSKIVGVGLASVEEGNPPSKFERVFAQARSYGYHVVAHAAEETDAGPAMIREALTKIGAERIDHGVGCMTDQDLVLELVHKQIPLTICPLSNIVLGGFEKLEDHPLKAMLDAGLMVSINSDDPAFFGGYIADNYQAVADALKLSCDDLVTCARNSFKSSFLDEQEKAVCVKKIDDYLLSHL